MIDLERRGDVAILRMAHGKANALDLEICDALTARLDECRGSSSSALVLTGAGAIFSAGVDLFRIVDSGAPYVRTFLPAVSRTFETLFTFPKPVVAAVNGHAIAGGCVMACAADYRLMATEPGRIGIPELLVGVPFPIVPLEILRFVAAPQYLQALAYRGTTLTPQAAVQQGLIDEAVEPDRLLDTAVAVAERLASLPPEAFAVTKRQLRAPALQRIREGSQYDAAVTQIWESAETLHTIRGYIARTLKKDTDDARRADGMNRRSSGPAS
ncbi:MAG: enoyl-CoA hydratase/isomerase family protein [Acidobacteria bacterium]|nr:enoyl-CoA hydratase/isomerase family protein [Acidobacteriota bacterium]